MMYEELINALRCCAKHERRCLECEFLHNGYCSLQLDAVAAIEAMQAEIRESMQKCAECGAEPITLEQAIDRLHELGWLQEHDRILSQPHWVSVKDELPPKATWVLAIAKELNVTIYNIATVDAGGQWWTTSPHKLMRELYGVRYWMPIEPPQEVQDGPIITPCRGCSDYDGYGGCKSKGGCVRAKMEVQDSE